MTLNIASLVKNSLYNQKLILLKTDGQGAAMASKLTDIFRRFQNEAIYIEQ